MNNKKMLNLTRQPEMNGRNSRQIGKEIQQPKDKSILNDPILFDDPPKQNNLIVLSNKGQPQNQKLIIVQQKHPKQKIKSISQSNDSSEQEKSYQHNAQEYRKTDKEEKKLLRIVRNVMHDEEYESNNSDFTQQQNGQVNNNQEDEENYEEEQEEEEENQENSQFDQDNQDEYDEKSEENQENQKEYEDNQEEDVQEYTEDEQPEEGDEDGQVEVAELSEANYQSEEDYYDNDDEQEEEEEEEEEEIEDRVKGKPQISDAAFRMLGFNLRRIDPTLPKDIVHRTQRDAEGRRIEITRTEQPIQVPIHVEPPKLRTTNIVAELRDRLAAKRQQNSQLQQELKYDCETQWRNFLFTDSMCTPANLADANNLRLYDSTFEVDDQFQLDTNLIVKPYVRSNQGKEETILRSDIGMVKSLHRLHQIFSERDKRKDDGKLVTIIDIFQYLSDRFRALNTELKQIESKNSNIYIFRIQYLEQLIRIYLLSYIEMMRADQTIDEIKQNKKNCKQYLIEALDNLIIDYSTLFHELNEERLYLLDNLPEYIQYYYLMLTLSILSTDSIQKISYLDFVIYSQFAYSQLLMKTPEYQFCKTIQECMILRNFNKILDFGKNIQITIFQQFFIYLLQEKIQELVESQKYSASFTGAKIQFNWVNLEEIYTRMMQIKNIIPLINNRGRFSFYISGKEQFKEPEIIQPIPQVNKIPPTNLKNILIEIGKKLILKKISNFLAPHFQSVEVQLGNFYRMLRIMNHWKLYMYKRKRVKKFKQQCQGQKQQKQLKLNEKQTFKSQLAAKLLNHLQSKNLYYKIVIISNNSHQSIVQKVVYSICEKTISNEDSLILECLINYKGEEYRLLLSIQIIQQAQEERMCGTDLFIIIGENYINKPCLQIIFDSQIESDVNLTINYNYLELFDHYFDSYEYNQKLMQTVDNSLKNKKPIEELELFSLPNFFRDVQDINLEKYDNNSIEYFISKCVLTELCLENVLTNNRHSDELPQELLFDRYINQESVLKYATKFNPGNNLMIPLCTKLKTYVSESDFVNDIKYYLEDYVDEEALLNLLRNHFSFGVTCKGDWRLLFEFIVCQLIQYLEETDIYFVVPKNYKIIIDEQQLYVRIQKDINQFTHKNSSSAMSKFLKQDLRDWVQKKICK